VVFSTIGLKRGLGRCELRIKVASPATGFTFIGPEEGVLYIAKDITIAQDYDGSLAAEADLQKLYGVTISKETRFVLRMGKRFWYPGSTPGGYFRPLCHSCSHLLTVEPVWPKRPRVLLER
jgi:hypothetical protein